MTSDDQVKDVLEVLWAAERDYGGRLSAANQVAVARKLMASRLADLTACDVEAAFRDLKLQLPPRGYANQVASRARLLHEPESLLDEILGFRGFAIANLSSEHGGRTKGNEEGLRNDLLLYLRRGYAEARTGRGKTDILLPPPEDAIIETKVWTSQSVYEDGLVELGRYIHTAQPKQAVFVVFGERDPLPRIVGDHTQEIAEVRELEGLQVPVIVVQFEVDPPSKARRNERRRSNARG